MAVTRFEDLIAWQKARVLAREIYLVTRRGEFSKDFDLVRQIRRSAVSIMANIAEGFERNRPLEFQRYLDMSRGSAAETLSHLYVALDVGYVSEEDFTRLSAGVDEIRRLLRGLRASLQPRDAAPTRDSGLRTRDSRVGGV